MHIKNDWKRDFTKAFNHSIGHGSFGKVILVRSKRNGQFFAMKEINLKQSILKSSIINRAYALDEGLKLRQLNATQHRNIIKYYKSYLYDDSIFWIMEYCDGGTLKDRINLYAKSDKVISEDLIWYWSMHILNGIKYIHNKGIIHRDLKPDNIYIESKRGVCKIGDFGFAKILVETSITENTSVKYLKFDEKATQQQQQQVKQVLVCKENVDEQKIAYKFIKVSQVGTPSYIAPELRMLIESHMTFCSIETVNKSIELCEENVYKGDIFSFGCILYELVHLRPAFENQFLLPLDDKYTQIREQLEQKLTYSHDIKNLIQRCLERNPHTRPSIKQLYSFESIKQRLNQDFIDAYKAQVIPRLIISKKNGPLEYLKVKLENAYKPISMKSLKFNQNLIVVLAYNQQKSQTCPKTKYKILTTTFNNMSPFQQQTPKRDDNFLAVNNESNLESNAPKLAQDQDHDLEVADIKFFIYNEYGELINEINSFVHETSIESPPTSSTSGPILTPNVDAMGRPVLQRHLLNFKVYDFLVDEEYDHLYMTTKKFGILRFKIIENNYYMEDLCFDGRVDLSEMYDEQSRVFKCRPTCLSLVENESVFKDSIKTTGKRRLIFNDNFTNRLISIQVDLISTQQQNSNYNNSFLNDKTLIKCNINDGLTLDKQLGTAKQLVCTANELICLFDNCGSNIINIYNLKTLQFKRSNEKNEQRK